MQITLAYIGGKDGLDGAAESFLKRCSSVARCRMEGYRTEAALMAWLERQSGRTPAVVVLLDARGRQMSSEAFAHWLAKRRDEGTQHVVFAIGPADGWSEEPRRQARLLLSLGSMTMAHALARLVMAEQIYRACTILTGHPYHQGH